MMEIILTQADFAAMKILSAVSDGMLGSRNFDNMSTYVYREYMTQTHRLYISFSDNSGLSIELSIDNDKTTAYRQMQTYRQQEGKNFSASDAPDPAVSEETLSHAV